VSALIWARIFTVSGQSNPYIAFRRPFLSRARAEQTAFTPYTPGAESDLNSDVTVANTAAAITGQGALATRNDVGTAQIASGAVTAISTFSDDSSINPGTSNTWTDVATLSVAVASGENVLVTGVCFAGPAQAWGDGFQYLSAQARLVRDSTVIRELPIGIVAAPVTIIDTDAPSAATYTYKLQVRYTIVGSGGSSPTPSVTNRSLIVQLFRR
jgi:hypothetical protein